MHEAASAAEAGSARDLVAAAYGAMGLGGEYRLDGGAQARDTLVTLMAKGTMRQWDPGESESVADLSKPDWGTASFTDLWNPGPAVAAANAAMTGIVRGMERAGVTPDKFAGGHGAVGSCADLARAVGPAG